MEIARNRQDLRDTLRSWRRAGRTIALVPTMGNLHAGHLALVEAARQRADRVVTSIFVNPTQFGPGEDLDRYPRTPEADIEALSNAKCDLVFAPGVDAIYPQGTESCFRLTTPNSLGAVLEGEFRPGHFDGVVTVVARLFNLVKPDVAVFGEKDYQQLQVIRRMVDDLGYDIEIYALETVRDESGLALSSRNRYLDAGQVEAARHLSSVLQEVARAAHQGDREYPELEGWARQRLEAFGLRPDYLSIRREHDLAVPTEGDKRLRVLAAAWCGKTRLIDNLSITLACNHRD